MDVPRKHIQLDLFRDQQAASFGRVIRTVSTDLGPFGNRTDLFVLDDSVRGMSLLECDDSDARYFNGASE